MVSGLSRQAVYNEDSSDFKIRYEAGSRSYGNVVHYEQHHKGWEGQLWPLGTQGTPVPSASSRSIDIGQYIVWKHWKTAFIRIFFLLLLFITGQRKHLKFYFWINIFYLYYRNSWTILVYFPLISCYLKKKYINASYWS